MKSAKAIIITIVLIMAETLINQGFQNHPGGGKSLMKGAISESAEEREDSEMAKTTDRQIVNGIVYQIMDSVARAGIDAEASAREAAVSAETAAREAAVSAEASAREAAVAGEASAREAAVSNVANESKSALNGSLLTIGNAFQNKETAIPTWRQGYYSVQGGKFVLNDSPSQITTDPIQIPAGVDVFLQTTKSDSGCSIREYAYIDGTLTRTRIVGGNTTKSVTLENTIEGGIYIFANYNSSGTVPADGELTTYKIMTMISELADNALTYRDVLTASDDLNDINVTGSYRVISPNIPANSPVTQKPYQLIVSRGRRYADGDQYIGLMFQLAIVQGNQGIYYRTRATNGTSWMAWVRVDASSSGPNAVAYISPSGSDSNSGTSPAAPFATVQKAIDRGYNNIILAPGKYKAQTVTISNKHGINIYCVGDLSEDTLIDDHVRKANAVIDNSNDITDIEEYGEIWRAPLSVESTSNYDKVFISRTMDIIYSASDYYGRVDTYNAILWETTDDASTTKLLVPVLTVTECETTQGTFTFDGSYLYINPYNGTITDKTFKRPYDESTTPGLLIENSTDIRIEGVDVAYFTKFNYKVNESESVQIQNAKSICTCYGSAFKFDASDAILKNCSAIRSGVDGFGISGAGDVSAFNCNAFYCNDDGISHHDAATGIIDGGEWAYCLKGGVTPSYGSRVTVKNIYAHDNVYGVYYVADESTRHTDTPLLLENSLLIDNTTNDLRVANYNVIFFGCIYRIAYGSGIVGYGNTILQ